MELPIAEPATEVQQVTTFESLEALRGPWAQLWTRCHAAGPLQMPEWLVPWWKYLRPGELWTLAVRRNGRLVGLVPLFLQHDQQRGRNTLLLLGTGNTDYLDVLLEPGSATQSLTAAVDYLACRHHRWQIAEFHNLDRASPLLTMEPPQTLSTHAADGEVCPGLTLPETVESLAKVVPKRQWQKLQYYRRRAVRMATVFVETARVDNLDAMLGELFRLHGARWSWRGLPGVLADEAVRAFHHEAASGFLQHGMLRLYALRFDDRVVAILYGFACRKRTYYYLGGFEPEVRHFSPGMLLVGHAIEEAVREGSREFDFLRGREAYKYDWGAQDRPTYRVRIE